VSDIKQTYDPTITTLPEMCPTSGIDTPLVNAQFKLMPKGGGTTYLKYTLSIFFTGDDVMQDLYDNVDSFDCALWSDKVYGAYGIQWEELINIHMDIMVNCDMALAMGLSVIILLAMFVHTKSLFITLIGLTQIILSFPLSYFVYNLVIGLEFFPFLNFIGVFVLFALGADDVFVMVDKWKNACLLHTHGSTELIAALSLPDALGAMFQTSFTTAVAFFFTAICPVAPIQMFSIFV
jgi:protein dispatched 1